MKKEQISQPLVELTEDIENFAMIVAQQPQLNKKANYSKFHLLTDEYLLSITEKQPNAVHISGEPVFVFRLVTKLKQLNIQCIASTTERIVEMRGNKKISTFQFVQFRAY